jgi:hypothetical protein
LGKIMAQKTLEVAGNNANVVLLVAESDNAGPNTPYGQAVDAFKKTLGNSIPIKNVEVVKTPPLFAQGSEPLSADKFVELLQKYTSTDLLVSFLGIPSLTQEQIGSLPTARPKVVAVVIHNPPAKIMFAEKVISLAALPKPIADTGAGVLSAQERFDAQYQLITEQTSELLPN